MAIAAVSDRNRCHGNRCRQQSSDSQVSDDLQTMADHDIAVVFVCEMAEVHQGRPRLPAGWRAVGMGEFMIIHAPGWQVGMVSLQRVWPTSDPSHPTQGWREYLLVANSTSSGSSQRGGSRWQKGSCRGSGSSGR